MSGALGFVWFASGLCAVPMGADQARAAKAKAKAKGKEAVTHWRKLVERGGLTLVEFRPETGRTHQIRIHAEHGLGHALLGDPVYGDARGAKRTMLHARALTVPREGKAAIMATAPLPADFLALGFSDADLGG